MASPEVPKDLEIIQAELKGICAGAGISYAEVRAIIESDDPLDNLDTIRAGGPKDPTSGKLCRTLQNQAFASAINQLIVLEHLWSIADPQTELERLNKEAKDDKKFDEKEPKGAYIAHLYKNPLIKQVVDKMLAAQGEPVSATASPAGTAKPAEQKTPNEAQKLAEEKTRLQKELEGFEATVAALGTACPQEVKNLTETKRGELTKVEEQIRAAAAKPVELTKPAEAGKTQEKPGNLRPEQKQLLDDIESDPYFTPERDGAKQQILTNIRNAPDAAAVAHIKTYFERIKTRGW